MNNGFINQDDDEFDSLFDDLFDNDDDDSLSDDDEELDDEDIALNARIAVCQSPEERKRLIILRAKLAVGRR